MTGVAILAAQLDEIAPLLARLRASPAGADAVTRRWRADPGGAEVAIAVSGMGRRRARAAAAALLDGTRASRLLVVGVAGALTPALEIGELVVAETIVTERGESLRADPIDLRPALELGARPAAVVTVDRMVATAADRRALLSLVPAPSPVPPPPGAVSSPIRPAASGAAGTAVLDPPAAGAPPAAVVDMESYDMVAEATDRGVPATVLRVVSDTTADTLPAFLERCRRPDGDLDRRRVILGAMMRPGWIPALLELRRRVRLCAERLAAPTLLLLAPSASPGADGGLGH